MLKLASKQLEIFVSDESDHQFHSIDSDGNPLFEKETCLSAEPDHATCQHGVTVHDHGWFEASHLLAADGGASGVHKHSALVHESRLFLAVGNQLCSLQIPSLDLVWKTQVDTATCFGVRLPPHRDCLISHGELEISRVDFDGNLEWQSSGADIFTGSLEVFEYHLEVIDFKGWRYRIDLTTGKNTLLSSS